MPAGRPLGTFKYTPEELLAKAQEYFDICDNTVIDKGIAGKITKPKTLSGLCLFIDVDKEYISEKDKDENFSGTIKKIRTVTENDVEEGILIGKYNPTSGIFNLKNNYGWKDKHEVEQTNANVDVTADISEEQKKIIANRIING